MFSKHPTRHERVTTGGTFRARRTVAFVSVSRFGIHWVKKICYEKKKNSRLLCCLYIAYSIDPINKPDGS